MNLYRIHLRSRSPWRTPWQADTLTGVLCGVAARVHGAEFLRRHLIEPMLAGEPPFVLSDAFPGDLLPLPMAARLSQPPPDADRKAIKSARWVTRDDFLALRAAGGDGAIPCERLHPDAAVFLEETTRHNTLARDSDASLEEGGLFARTDTMLRSCVHEIRRSRPRAAGDVATVPNPVLNGADQLTLYFRSSDDEAHELLLDLLHELALTGFGADIATGRGQFDILGDPEPCADLDDPPPDANGVICLSTFQPAPDDPTDGYWETFPKFGKLGPNLGLTDVRKHTLIMFRPGACFRSSILPPFLGRALPMNDVLPTTAVNELRQYDIEIIHPAFGLAVPSRHSWEIHP